MQEEVKPRRRYNSDRRRSRAEERRREILAAASELFLALGYRSATVEAIAERAGVASETVYAAYGNKSRLLARVMDVAVVGDAEQVPLMQRGWVQEVLAEGDPHRRLDRLVALTTSVLARVGPLHAVVRSAMDGDPELRALKLGHDRSRLEAQLEFMRMLEPGLRPELSLEAARDIYWTVASPDVHNLLIGERGWSDDQYREWLGSVLRPALLGQE